jgi:rubrerythrin
MQDTKNNLETAFFGEAGAYAKYLWFAKICRDQGYDEVADHFEWTASQELKHAWGHLELMHNLETPSAYDCLTMAIAGETYEYTEMYPKMLDEAMLENNSEEAAEMREQILESKTHAEEFQRVLEVTDLAERRFRALKSVEQRHAEKYQAIKETL